MAMIIRFCNECKMDYMFDALDAGRYGKICQTCYETSKDYEKANGPKTETEVMEIRFWRLRACSEEVLKHMVGEEITSNELLLDLDCLKRQVNAMIKIKKRC